MHNTNTGLALSVALSLAYAAFTSGCAATPAEEEAGTTESQVTADPGSADKITIIRSFRPGAGHWLSVREAPAGFTPEVRYTIRLRGQRALFACGYLRHNFVSLDPNCEGQQQQGFLGYADQNAEGTRQRLFRCMVPTGDHFVSTDEACEGYVNEGLLGWVEDAAQIAPPVEQLNPGQCRTDWDCGQNETCVRYGVTGRQARCEANVGDGA